MHTTASERGRNRLPAWLRVSCFATALLACWVAAADAGESRPLDLAQAQQEVRAHYQHAHPQVQEYVLWTARKFGPGGLWLNENAYAADSPQEQEERVQYLVKLFADAEYGRLLCRALAEASARKDPRLVQGLLKVAGYHRDDADYDCRPKWMAVAALARQESDDAVPLLISLLDHGNQNTRIWARAALSRQTRQDFQADKQAWAKWWVEQGHPAVAEKYLQPWVSPVQPDKPAAAP